MLLAVSMSGCVSLFTSASPPECETRVREVLTKIGDVQECFELAKPQLIVSGPGMPNSIKLTAFCKSSIEAVIVADPSDKELQRLILTTPNVKRHGACVNETKPYDIYSSSFSLKEVEL